MPGTGWSVPVSSIDRVGEQAGAEWKSVNRIPACASRSRLGVSISLPKAPISENPRSSATITRKLGLVTGKHPVRSTGRMERSDYRRFDNARNLTRLAGMIGVTRVEDVLTIELQRPDRRNALNSQLVEELREAVEKAAGEDVHAIVLTGQGTVFCAGADL